MDRIRARFVAFRQAKDGATAVEFAIVAMPFFLLLFAILEVAFIFFATTVIENAVVATSRQLRVGTVTTEAQFRDVLCDRVRMVVSCEDLIVDVRGLNEFIDSSPGGDGDGDCGDGPGMSGCAPGQSGQGGGGGLGELVGGLLGSILGGGGDGGGDGGGGPQFDPGEPGQIMVASALYEWQVIVPNIGLGLTNMHGNRRLVIASSAYRNEPEGGVEP